MLISFEGLDNCGKTTIVGKLKKYYDGLNILTDFTREFETNIGREIKEMSKAGVLDPVLKLICLQQIDILEQKYMKKNSVTSSIQSSKERLGARLSLIMKPPNVVNFYFLSKKWSKNLSSIIMS